MRGHSHPRTAHGHGFAIFIMSVMMFTAIDSSNVMDDKFTPCFRESLSTVMLMDLFVMGYVIVRDIRRFRLTSALITATFDMVAEQWLRHDY